MKPADRQFCLDRAAECRGVAASSSLVEVKRKYADAAESWVAMATLALARENERSAALDSRDRSN